MGVTESLSAMLGRPEDQGECIAGWRRRAGLDA